ncbi:hypothetical protein SO694_0000532 [Aureococcus anophagefferens]|uniref:Uncharacterized protein n=1 Tax=Aureococcus anophagefferens TaxID=44056 RepID=A0ABR1GA72_AURAN
MPRGELRAEGATEGAALGGARTTGGGPGGGARTRPGGAARRCRAGTRRRRRRRRLLLLLRPELGEGGPELGELVAVLDEAQDLRLEALRVVLRRRVQRNSLGVRRGLVGAVELGPQRRDGLVPVREGAEEELGADLVLQPVDGRVALAPRRRASRSSSAATSRLATSTCSLSAPFSILNAAASRSAPWSRVDDAASS